MFLNRLQIFMFKKCELLCLFYYEADPIKLIVNYTLENKIIQNERSLYCDFH